MKSMIVTTSWDDGHKLDLKLAALLKKYGIKGTFYISPKDHEFAPGDRLTPSQIRQLAQDFEIGAHTMTHPILPSLSLAAAKKEIVDSKTYLEELTKKPVRSFCYPAGLYNTQIKDLVRSAGFTYARTVEQLWHTTERGAYDAPTTVHAFSHWFDLYKIARFARWNPFRFLRYLLQWDRLAMDLFDHTQKTSGVFHLWGHSWELDRRNDWDRLERVLKYIQQHTTSYQLKTNGEIATLYTPKRRVLTVTPYFPPYPGGLEKYAHKLTTGLAEQYGWDAHVLTTTATNDHNKLHIHTLKPTFVLSNTPIGLFWPIQVRKLLRRLRPDIIYVHMPVPGLGDIAARLARMVPLVITYHFGSMQKGKWHIDWLIRWYERSLLPGTFLRASALVASSMFVRTTMFASYRNVTSIPPGVDIKSFSRPRASKRKNNVLFVGNYSRAAQHKGLQEAMQAIGRMESRPTLTVVGQSDITDWYRQQAKALGVRVQFAGVLNERQLIKQYRQASVLVLPSTMESYPMVVAEALAGGLPVIAYDVGGLKELVKDGKTGYLLAAHDVTGLQKRLSQLIDHPAKARQMGRAGQLWAKQNLDWSKKCRAVQQLFETLLKGQRP